MVKNIIKQVIIAILLCIIIGLVLAVILYQYIPTNAMVPTKVEAYATPENIATEIQDSVQEQTYETTNTLLEVTDSDLSTYKSTGSYNPGKSNPFSDSVEDDSSASTDSQKSEETSGKSTDPSNTSSQKKTDSTDNYYQNAGIGRGTK